jgi:hypothetical protein
MKKNVARRFSAPRRPLLLKLNYFAGGFGAAFAAAGAAGIPDFTLYASTIAFVISLD